MGDHRLTPMQVVATGEAPGGVAWNDWMTVAGGARHNCGLRAGRTLWCWGWGESGQRGDGSTESARTTPIAVIDVP